MLRILFGDDFPRATVPSTVLLLLAGLAPLLGLWGFGWGAAALFAFYAVELALVFVAIVARILSLRAAGDPARDVAPDVAPGAAPDAAHGAARGGARWVRAAAKPFAILDLLPRYLVTWLVFVAAAGWQVVRQQGSLTLGPLPLVGWGSVAVLLLVASQAGSFVAHHLQAGERATLDLGRLYTRANARLLLVQMPLIVALVLASLLGDARWPLAVVVVLKTVAEVRVHEAERERQGWLDRIEAYTGFGA